MMITCGGSRLPAVNIISSDEVEAPAEPGHRERDHRREEQRDDHRRDRDDQRVQVEAAAKSPWVQALMKLSKLSVARQRDVAVRAACRAYGRSAV